MANAKPPTPDAYTPTPERIRVFKMPAPRNPRFPWGATYPLCPFMGKGGGWPTWESAMRQAYAHLADQHSDSEACA